LLLRKAKADAKEGGKWISLTELKILVTGFQSRLNIALQVDEVLVDPR
jgi:hypothetical protein